MLTLKHVEASGHESMIAAREVSFHPQGKGPERAELTAFGVPGPDEGARSGGVVRYDCGKVFVMNDNGKTVATYDLGTHD